MKPGHYVHILGYTEEATVKTLGPYASARQAERAESGVERNLDHENYYTMIEEAS